AGVVAEELPPANPAPAAEANAALTAESPKKACRGPAAPAGRRAAGAAGKRSKRARAPVEEEEAEQRLDAGPVLPRDDQPKRKAKRAQKAKVPAEEEAEVVEEEVELPASAGDDGAGVGDIPLEDPIQEKKRREEKAERKKMERRVERLPITFEYRLHCQRKMQEIGKQLDYVQRQIQEAPAWIERAEELERTYALGRYRSWRSKCGGRNSFPDHELHWVVAMFSRSSKQDQETAQAVERSTWFNSDGSVRKGPPCHRGCANAATCNGGTGCSVYRDACKTFGEGSEEFCRHMLERGPFLQQSKFSPLSELLRQFPDGVPADYPLPEYWRAGSGRTPALSPIAWGVPGVQEAGSASPVDLPKRARRNARRREAVQEPPAMPEHLWEHRLKWQLDAWLDEQHRLHQRRPQE
ncbi:unnamed protein product, partial [Symbiodinium sp. KB8]